MHRVSDPCLPIALNELKIPLHPNYLTNRSVLIKGAWNQMSLQWNQCMVNCYLLMWLIQLNWIGKRSILVMSVTSVIQSKELGEEMTDEPESLVIMKWLDILGLDRCLWRNINAHKELQDQDTKRIDILLWAWELTEIWELELGLWVLEIVAKLIFLVVKVVARCDIWLIEEVISDVTWLFPLGIIDLINICLTYSKVAVVRIDVVQLYHWSQIFIISWRSFILIITLLLDLLLTKSNDLNSKVFLCRLFLFFEGFCRSLAGFKSDTRNENLIFLLLSPLIFFLVVLYW